MSTRLYVGAFVVLIAAAVVLLVATADALRSLSMLRLSALGSVLAAALALIALAKARRTP